MFDAPTYPMKKEEWGRSYWITLHHLAANYPEKPTRKQRKEMKDTIEGIFNNVPCEECSENSKEHLKKLKINYKNRKTLSESLCKIHNMVNSNLGKEVVNCDLILEEDCKNCNITMQDVKYDEYLKSIRTIIIERCKEANVKEPKIVFGQCPENPDTSCTVADIEKSEAVIYINPSQASLRTIEHEVEHYIRVKKHTGDHLNEYSVDSIARNRMNSTMKQVIMADNQIDTKGKLVLNDTQFDGDDGKGGTFSILDKVYQPLSQATGIKNSDLNDANTPEIIGYTANAITDMFMTPLGTVLVNIITGITSYGATMVMDIPVRDKKFLAEFGSHQFWSIIRYANPNTNTIAHSQAMEAGRAFKNADLSRFVGSFVKTNSKSFGVNTPRNVDISKIRNIPKPIPKPAETYYFH